MKLLKKILASDWIQIMLYAIFALGILAASGWIKPQTPARLPRESLPAVRPPVLPDDPLIRE
jgi:hypothetical protein